MTECEWGLGYTPFLELLIMGVNHEVQMHFDSFAADCSGTTSYSMPIKKSIFPKGFYNVYVNCVREMNDGSGQVLDWARHEGLGVKRAKKKPKTAPVLQRLRYHL